MRNNTELKYPESPSETKKKLIKLQETLNSESFPAKFNKIDMLAQKVSNEIMETSNISSKTLKKPFNLI